MTKQNKFYLLCLIIVTGLFTAIAFHWFLGFYLKKGYPYNTFLFLPSDRFMDFINPLRGSFDGDPYNPGRIGYIGGYFPFGYGVAYLLSLIHPWRVLFEIFLDVVITYLFLYVIWYLEPELLSCRKWDRVIKISMALIIAYFTYPVIFVIDRGNFDIIVFILISLFVIFYQKKNYILSALLLSCAIAMKAYPVMLLVLFLMDRHYKEFLLAAICVVVFTVGSLTLFKGGLFIEFQKMMASFQSAFSIAFVSGELIRFNSSLYTALLLIFNSINFNIAQDLKFNIIYLVFIVGTYLFVTFIMWKRAYPFWAKLLLLMVMMILLPQSSGDYRLILLYPPIMIFLNNDEKLHTDWIIIVQLGLLLIPKAYYYFYNDSNIGLLINPFLLISLMGITLISVEKNLSGFLGLRSESRMIKNGEP